MSEGGNFSRNGVAVHKQMRANIGKSRNAISEALANAEAGSIFYDGILIKALHGVTNLWQACARSNPSVLGSTASLQTGGYMNNAIQP